MWDTEHQKIMVFKMSWTTNMTYVPYQLPIANQTLLRLLENQYLHYLSFLFGLKLLASISYSHVWEYQSKDFDCHERMMIESDGLALQQT